jgi:Xaa-Pro aminopeptidase
MRARLTAGSLVALLAAPSPLHAGDSYRTRRDRLLGRLAPGEVAVVYGAERLGEGQRQRADFQYLTGLGEEGAVLVLWRTEKKGHEALFLAPRDPEAERWTGARESLGSTLEKRTGVREVLRTTGLAARLAEITARAGRLAFLGPIARLDAPVPPELRLYRKLQERAPWLSIENRTDLLPEMRAVKDAGELGHIRRAVAISIEGHFAAWRAIRPGMKEHELKEKLERAMRRGGATRLAYPSIVGSGPHSCVLHYPGDRRVIKEGELVVIDAGAEVAGYASDVTRTVPASGKFTSEQRRIYEIVLAAQKAALARVRPGARLREDVHAAARRVIAQAGFVDAFFHGTSHFVGLRVHDVGHADRPLAPGMVLTVEPGIYLADRKLGVRIEDTVVVTADGHENLSAGLPKEVEEIEKWMAAARGATP